jgi:hypothetical protein
MAQMGIRPRSSAWRFVTRAEAIAAIEEARTELDCHLEMKLLFDECAPRNSLSVSGNRFIPWNSSWVVAGFLRVLTFIGAHHLEFQSTWHARFASG